MRMRLKPILQIGLCLLWLFGAIPDCASAEAGAENYHLDELVVTAEKPQTENRTGDVNEEETTSFHSVIKREEFEGKVEDLGELIEKEVGVQVRRSGGLGSFSQVSLRGSDSDQVLVFLDGILLNDASSGTVDLSSIALSDVAQIEIYRGITPINFGKSSIGGAINIRTLRTEEGLKANVNAGYGSFDTRQFNGFVNQKCGKWDYLVSVSYLASANDFTFVNDYGTQYNSDDDREEHRHNAQFDQYNVLSKGGYEISDTVRIDLLNQWFSKDQGIPNWINSPDNDTSYATDRNISTLMLTANDLGSLHFNTRTRFDYLWKKDKYRDLQGDIGLGKQDNTYLTNRYGGDFYIEQPGRWWILKWISDIHFEDYKSEDHLNLQSSSESTRFTFSTALESDLLFFRDLFILTPAVRFLYLQDDLRSGITSFGTPLEPQSQYETFVNPQVGLKILATNWLTLKANVADYARPPTFSELFGDRGLVVGNPDLQAETGVNVDGGFDIHWQGDNGLLQRVSTGLSIFRSNVSNLITYVYDARGIGRAENISRSEISGIEGTLQVEFLRYLRLIWNITHLNTVNLSEVKAFNGKQLPGRWENDCLLRLEAEYRKVKVYGEYHVLSGLYYDSANLLPAKNQDLINTGISWLYEPFLLRFDVENIKNINYEYFNGFPTPGISFSASATYSYRF